MSSTLSPHRCDRCGKEFDEYLKLLAHKRLPCKKGEKNVRKN